MPTETGSFTEKKCPECEGTGRLRVRTKSGQGRRAKSKGNRGELKIAKQIGELLGVGYGDVRRTPNSGALIERSDLRMSEEVHGRFPVYVEVKNRENWTLDNLLEVGMGWVGFEWLNEAKLKLDGEKARGNIKGERLVVVILKKNFHDPLVLWDSRDVYGSRSCICLRLGPFRIAPLSPFVHTFSSPVEGESVEAQASATR